jgi:LEA14-like dessication related protein
MTRKILQLLAPIALVAFGTGCDDIEPYLPKVRFDHFDVSQISFDDADVDFVFAVDNPDPVSIDLSSFSYAFDLEDVNLLDGDDPDGMTLEAVGSSDLALPVHLTWQSVWETVQATRGLDNVGFGLKGDFGFDTPIGEAVLPYDAGGDFPAVRTPKFSFKKVHVRGIDVFSQTADIDVDLGVTNEHASSLIFDNFDYDLSLGGTHVANGNVDELGEAMGATESTLTLPVKVNLLHAGSAVWDALSGQGDLNIGLGATSDVDTPFGLLPLSLDESGRVSVGQ